MPETDIKHPDGSINTSLICDHLEWLGQTEGAPKSLLMLAREAFYTINTSEEEDVTVEKTQAAEIAGDLIGVLKQPSVAVSTMDFLDGNFEEVGVSSHRLAVEALSKLLVKPNKRHWGQYAEASEIEDFAKFRGDRLDELVTLTLREEEDLAEGVISEIIKLIGDVLPNSDSQFDAFILLADGGLISEDRPAVMASESLFLSVGLVDLCYGLSTDTLRSESKNILFEFLTTTKLQKDVLYVIRDRIEDYDNLGLSEYSLAKEVEEAIDKRWDVNLLKAALHMADKVTKALSINPR